MVKSIHEITGRGWATLHPMSKAIYKETYFRGDEDYEEWLEDRCSKFANDEAHKERLKTYIRNRWFHFSTPPSSGAGLPISCYVSHIPDNREGIFDGYLEGFWLGAEGGGRGVNWNEVGGLGRPIGVSDSTLSAMTWKEIQKADYIAKSAGTVPFLGVSDRATYAISQANVRRSTEAAYMFVDHIDVKHFIDIRLETGDRNRRTPNLHHGIVLTDKFMEAVRNLEPWDLYDRKTGKVADTVDAFDLFMDIVECRKTETGEPYILYIDNVNRNKPEEYKRLDLDVTCSNICCLTGDTEVVTRQGITAIKDLVGKTVDIFDGLNWVSCDNFKEYGTDTVYKITLKNGTILKANKEHRWFAAESYNDINAKNYKEFRTKDLKPGMWLEDNIKEARFDGPEELAGAYVKGFLLGDGTINNLKPQLHLHSTKYMCENKILSSLNEVPLNNTLRSDCIKIPEFSDESVYPNQLGKQVYKRLKGLTARSDELSVYSNSQLYPKRAFIDYKNLSVKSKLELLSGLFDADGTYSTSGIQLTSVHKPFIKRLQKCIQSLGYNASIDEHGGKHRVTIGNYDSWYLFDELSCVRLEKPEIQPNRRTTGYRQVMSIEELHDESVYCPQIPTTGKFLLANGILTGNTEIMLYTAPDTTAVCCLGSANLEYYDEYKDILDMFVADCLDALDNILTYFLKETENYEGTKKEAFKRARKSIIDSRDVGLGTMGWHSLLQKKRIPFESPMAVALNKQIFTAFRVAADEYQERLCTENPELICPMSKRAGTKRRNIHCLATAPTMGISTLSDLCSSGIEPWLSNAFVKKIPQGSFSIKNKYLTQVLVEYADKLKVSNTDEWLEEQWGSIIGAKGSVQHLDYLDDYIKDVFKTAFEINPMALLKQMSDRAPLVDQGVSNNLFLPATITREELYQIHFLAWELGIKSLYYLRSQPESDAKVGKSERKAIVLEDDACVACT